MIPTSEINSSFRYLLISRAARSVALIFVTLSLPLYLLAINFSIVIIGLLYLFMTLFTVFLMFSLGIVGDRIGYKNSLIIGEIPGLVVMLILSLTTNHALIAIATVLGGVGGAPGGMRGAFAPGASALIARNWPNEEDRVSRLAAMTFVSSTAAIGGSLLLVFHGFMLSYVTTGFAFRILYSLGSVLMLFSVLSLLLLKEREKVKKRTILMQKESGIFTAKVVLTNIVNGSGLGLSVSLLPAWFALMYHADSSSIGTLFTASYAATSIGSFVATKLRYGGGSRPLLIGSITRIFQGLIMVPIAIMPSFFIAAVLYAARSAIAGVGTPARTAINISGIRDGDFGTASSIQGVSMRLSQSTSGAAGYLMDVSLPLPLVGGGLIQALGGIVYYLSFRKGRIKSRK